MLLSPLCHKLSHLGSPPPQSVTYFMDGPFAKCIRQNFLISILPPDLLICLEGKTLTNQHIESAFYPHRSANQQTSILPLPVKDSYFYQSHLQLGRILCINLGYIYIVFLSSFQIIFQRTGFGIAPVNKLVSLTWLL